MRIRTSILWAGVLVCGAFLAGCAPEEPAPPIAYRLRSPRSVHRLHRVVFVELGDACRSPSMARGLTEEIHQALQKRALFHVDVVSRADPACRDLPLDVRGGLSLEQVGALRRALECDGVLVGALTRAQPHPRMQAAVYLRLFNVRDGTLVWGVDHVWDTTEHETQRRVRAFWRDQMRNDYEPVDWRLVRMSPRAFQKFVAYEIARTLPARSEE